jgi:hypothetical protein
MSKIFKYQTYVRIQLEAGVSVAGALATEIKYLKPGGDTGSLPATVYNTALGILYYDVPGDSSEVEFELDEAGRWSFWTWVTFADGRTARGDTYNIQIYDEDQ